MGGFGGKHVLVVGGAGFVGSRLVRRLLADEPRRILVVDNLLSSERENLPAAAAITFVEGSIADDRVLAGITDDLDYVFHLATYHGNQSSIADPLADHEHNTLTSLKLFRHLSRFRRLTKVVYASAGCSVAAKTFGILAGEGINIQGISTSEIKISCIIDKEDGPKALQIVHDAFELGNAT